MTSEFDAFPHDWASSLQLTRRFEVGGSPAALVGGDEAVTERGRQAGRGRPGGFPDRRGCP